MNQTSILWRLEKKYTWGVIGCALGLLGLVIGASQLVERRARVRYEVLSEANVLDVRKPLKELQILFQGQNIGKENLNLRLITLRVENDGDIDILQNQFDQHDIWGVRVYKGRVIEVRPVEFSSKYLAENLKPTMLAPDQIRFNKVIFERKKAFILEILTLHQLGENPEIIPLGKIAGIDEFPVEKTWMLRQQPSFWKTVFRGSIAVHFTRAVAYLLGCLGFLLAAVPILLLISNMSDRKTKRRREFLLERINLSGQNDPVSMAIKEIFLKHGQGGLIRARAIIGKKGMYDAVNGPIDTSGYTTVGFPHDREKLHRQLEQEHNRALISILSKAGLKELADGTLEVPPSLLMAVNKFSIELTEKEV